MADKKIPMGDDPLAWLAEGDDGDNASSTPAKKSRTRKIKSKDKEAEVKTEAELIEESFAALAPQSAELAKRFYERLFEVYPQLSPLFEGVSITGQEKKLLASLVLLVQNLQKPDVLKDYLTGLGARHVHYGVTEDHYPMVAENLLTVMSEFAGELWTSEVQMAWQNTLNTVTTIMLEANELMEASEMTNKDKVQQELMVMQAAVDGASTALMMCDKDLVITYANPAVMRLLENRLPELRKVFPNLDLSKVVGTCIDDFHKAPSLQRGILSDLDNLPYRNQIQLLDIHFDLNATAIVDADGNYMGNMVEWQDITEVRERELEAKNAIAAFEGQLDAISKAMGVISFELDGTIVDVNQNFLDVVGYSKEEIIGQHHRMFAEPSLANSLEYTEFWKKLNRGEFDSGEYKRIGKGGKEIWLQASYSPILDINGKPVRVVKYATDMTNEKLMSADSAGQLDAIDKAMGVISFNMDGTIIDVNDNFLSVVGYSKEQVVGQHHRMFAEPSLAASPEYTEFWAKLNRGEFDSGEYKRLGNRGNEIWLQASYNPIMDLNGKPFKVVKYAADISEQKILQMTVENVLSSTATVMNAMSEGDLTNKMEGEYEGEFALLQTAVNNTVSKIAQTMEDINDSSESISTAAGEISEGNIDLSQRTEQQASSLEETASSMEELTSTVRQNSDNARQANQLATSSREQAEQGGSVIKEAIDAMAAISASSKKVTDIIGVIDEIAFQTNLLALNAAVEAARAGEQGRGFAVVASEVRNLAQRSASAAKEIKELINDSGEKVKEGSMLVDESGRTLEEIVASSKKVGDIISEIAAAGAEQTQGIEQVNKAVTQMDEMTQQNAALVEEAAAASEALDEQGQGLKKLVGFFDIGHAPSTEPVRPARSPASMKPVTPAPRPKPAAKPRPAAPAPVSDDDEWDEF